MILKTIFPLFLTLLIGIFPLRVVAMEGRSDDESSEYSHSESTLQYPDTEHEQSATVSAVTATAGAGSGFIDDDTAQTGISAVDQQAPSSEPDMTTIEEKEANADDQSEEEQHPLSLEQFREALNNFPYAVRFTIKEREDGQRSIYAQEGGKDATRGINKSENMEIVATLRALIYEQNQQLCEQIKFDDLFSLDIKKSGYPSLSAEKLRAIFDRMNQASRRLAEHVEEKSVIQEHNERPRFRLDNHELIISNEKKQAETLLQQLVNKAIERSDNPDGIEHLSFEFFEPPIDSFQEQEWNLWSDRLIRAANGKLSKVKYIADYGLSDPIGAYNQCYTTFTAKAVPKTSEELQSNEYPPVLQLRLPFQGRQGLTLKKLEQHGLEQIEAPRILDKVFEVRGRALLYEARKIKSATEGKTASSSQKVDLVADPMIIIPRKPTIEDLTRWEAAKAVEELMEKRDQLLAESQSHYVAKMVVTTTRKLFRFVTLQDKEEPEEVTIGKKKKESDTVSASTSVSTQSKQKKSIYSHTSAKSKFSNDSLNDLHATAFLQKAELKQLQSLNRELIKRADFWANLVRQADRARRSSGGAHYPNEEALFAAWEEADEKAQQAEDERQKREEQLIKIKRGEQNWEQKTLRWEAREHADCLKQDLIDHQNDLKAVEKKSDKDTTNKLEKVLLTLQNEYQQAEQAWLILAHQTMRSTMASNMQVSLDQPMQQLMFATIEKCQLANQQKQLGRELKLSHDNYLFYERQRDSEGQTSHWKKEITEVKKYWKKASYSFKEVQNQYARATEELSNLLNHSETQPAYDQVVRQTRNLFHQDQALIAFWKKFSNPRIIETEETAKEKATRLNQAVGAHQIDFVEEKNKFFERCFKEANDAEIAAQAAVKKYQIHRSAESRTTVEQLYAAADQLEQKAEQDYATWILQRASEDAWTKAEVAQLLWNSLSQQQSIKAAAESVPAPVQQPQISTVFAIPSLELNPLQQEGNKFSHDNDVERALFQELHALYTIRYSTAVIQAIARAKDELAAVQENQTSMEQFQQKLLQEYDPTFRKDRRLRAIGLIHKKAFEAFQVEAKNFSDIEAIWKMQRKAEEKRKSFDILTAVRDYCNGNINSWTSLSDHDRAKYNQSVDEANELKHDAVIENLKKNGKDVAHLIEQSTGNSIVTKPASYWDRLDREKRQTVDCFIRLWIAEDERTRALRWGQLTPQEREKEFYAKEGIDFYREAESKEEDFLEQLKEDNSNLSLQKRLDYWNKILERAIKIADVWKLAAQNFKMGSGFLQDPTEINLKWIKRSEAVAAKEQESIQRLLLYEAYKIDTAAGLAKEAVEKASNHERAFLWLESLELGKKAAETWAKLEKYIEGDSSVASERTFWLHWITRVNDLVFDHQKTNTLYQNANAAFDNARIDQTEKAWSDAAEQSRVILHFLEQQCSDSALIKIQNAIWNQRVKTAETKVLFIRTKDSSDAILKAIQHYINQPEIGVQKVYSAGITNFLNDLTSLENKIANLKNIDLTSGEKMAVTARTTAAGAGAGVAGLAASTALLGVCVTATPVVMIGGIGYLTYERGKEASNASEVLSTGALSLGGLAVAGLSVAITPISYAIAGVVLPIAGPGIWGTMAAQAIQEKGYENVRARSRSAAVMRSVMDAEALHQTALLTLEVVKNSFSKPSFFSSIKIPSAAQAVAASEASSRINSDKSICQSQGSLWKEEGSWLWEVANQVSTFAIIAESKKK